MNFSDNNNFKRRDFLTLSAGAGAALALNRVALAQAAPAANRGATGPTFPLDAAAVLHGGTPQAPYIVWGGAEFYTRNPEIYSNMTLDASGYVDPRVLAATGRYGLNYVEGTQTTNARGSYYWKDAASRVRRTYDAFHTLPPLTSAGVAVMNWGGPLPEKKPDNEKWMLEGLREAKKADPTCFVAAWVTQPNDAMFEAGRDGTVDLFIVQGFTHQVPGESNADIVSFDEATKRQQAFSDAGLGQKTIFGFGYLDRDAVLDGQKLSKEWLGARMQDIKTRFPNSPGVAFLQTSTTRGDGTMDLIRYCNARTGELWPRPLTNGAKV